MTAKEMARHLIAYKKGKESLLMEDQDFLGQFTTTLADIKSGIKLQPLWFVLLNFEKRENSNY
jgi:hypothetical protein